MRVILAAGRRAYVANRFDSVFAYERQEFFEGEIGMAQCEDR